MKKVLFLDRDGTIIKEPEDQQVDSFEKLEFLPGVITSLSAIVKTLDYDLVMVTNQDGLGSPSFPEELFWPVHNKMLQILAAEGILFKDVYIDRSFPCDASANRKPGTGMLGKYLAGGWDLAASYVIGDRQSDVLLAKNCGAQAIFIGKEPRPEAALTAETWPEIRRFLELPARRTLVKRETAETKIALELCLDGSGRARVNSGLGFLDHMLQQVAVHAGLDLTLTCEGDLQVDEHHTIEDVAIALGQAINRALGNRRGIERYGFVLPMDEALAQVVLDLSGRCGLKWRVSFSRQKVGDFPTDMFKHFFKSLSHAAECTLHVKAAGENDHHKAEAVFKAFARALRDALQRCSRFDRTPSSKGLL